MIKVVLRRLHIVFLVVMLLALLANAWAAAADIAGLKRLETKAQWLFELREDMTAANAAIETYQQILRLDPKHYLAPQRLAKLYIWVGFHMNEDIKYYDMAVSIAEKAVKLHPGKAGPIYWLGVAYGLKATAPETGTFTCLSLLDPIETNMKKLIELDPHFEHGGPWRVLGRLNTKTPYLLGGDKELAEKYLRKAVRQGPQFYLNHLYLADLLGRIGKRDEGIALVKQVLKGEAMPGLEPETMLWKRTARQVLNQQAKLDLPQAGERH
jgi:tetratricopeptide (TPR) repeat protein